MFSFLPYLAFRPEVRDPLPATPARIWNFTDIQLREYPIAEDQKLR
jgi:hypothetical protein